MQHTPRALIVPIFADFPQATKGGTTQSSTTHGVNSFQNGMVVVMRVLNSNTSSQEVSDQCLSLGIGKTASQYDE